jgi:hypothetical protein
MEQFVFYSVFITSNRCFILFIWIGVIRSADQNVHDLVLNLLVESATKFCNDPESFHVARLVYELSEVIDILINGALPLVVSHGLEFGEGNLGFILWAELSDEGFAEHFPDGVFGSL